MKEVELRCRFCHSYRFKVVANQKIAPCPGCGIRWRLKWFDDTPLIVGMESWNEWEQKMRAQIGKEK